MPITSFQTEVLALLARQRDAESYVAGGVPINLTGPRYSADIDIFHDRQERVATAAEADAALLRAAGLTVEWLRQAPSIVSAIVARGAASTKLEWVADSDFRYFPAVPDPRFGYVLHIADLAVNKIMAAVGRREPRDVVDLLTIHENYLPLGAVACAAVVVAPGFTPEGLLAEVGRNARYRQDDFDKLVANAAIDAADVARRLRAAIVSAEAFVARMPTDKVGLLFLTGGRAVEPDPARLDDYEAHAPQRRGHWPSSSEITHAMLERYGGRG